MKSTDSVAIRAAMVFGEMQPDEDFMEWFSTDALDERTEPCWYTMKASPTEIIAHFTEEERSTDPAYVGHPIWCGPCEGYNVGGKWVDCDFNHQLHHYATWKGVLPAGYHDLQCYSYFPPTGHRCTLNMGHIGLHVAGNEYRWADDDIRKFAEEEDDEQLDTFPEDEQRTVLHLEWNGNERDAWYVADQRGDIYSDAMRLIDAWQTLVTLEIDTGVCYPELGNPGGGH